ncbi:MAG: binding domain protein [Oscillospiraceae bacterium]|nr:binding domain protein [Oscillospiraceae bacterium]
MQLEVGKIVEGKVTGITKFGAFVEISEGVTGMVHISEVASTFVKEISEHLKENQVVKVKVLSIGEDGKISLSIKKAIPPSPAQKRPFQRQSQSRDFSSRRDEPMSFEDMMSKFKQSSDEKMSDLKKFMDNKRGSYSKRGSK